MEKEMENGFGCECCGRRDFIYGLLSAAAVTGVGASAFAHELEAFLAVGPKPTPPGAIPDKTGAVKSGSFTATAYFPLVARPVPVFIYANLHFPNYAFDLDVKAFPGPTRPSRTGACPTTCVRASTASRARTGRAISISPTGTAGRSERTPRTARRRPELE